MAEKECAAASAPPSRAAWRRLLSNLALLLGSCLVALILAEIVFRAIYWFPQPTFLRIDDVVGHRLRANLTGYYVEEGFSHFSINSHGMRDREFSVRKPAGVFRLAVVGDSYAEALQVELGETFCKQLESRLQNVEVLNFGVSGYGTAQEYLTFAHFVWPFEPDLVLLAVCSGNDISDNSRALSGGYPRPYYVLKDGRLELDNGFRNSRRHRLLKRWGGLYYFVTDHSAVAEAIDRWRRRVSTARKPPAAGNNPTSGTVEAGLSLGINGPPNTPELKAAWEVTERLIAELRRAAHDRGTSLAVLTVTTGSQVDPRMRERTAREHPDWDLDYADRRVAQCAERNGAPALVLAPGFLEFARRSGRFLHGFNNASRGHWNAEGHRLAAELLRQFVAERKLVPPEHLK